MAQGKVILSGRLRGRVPVGASDEIIIGDDLTYVTDPGQGSSVAIMRLFSGDDNYTRYAMDDTKDEFVHGVVQGGAGQ